MVASAHKQKTEAFINKTSINCIAAKLSEIKKMVVLVQKI